MPSNDPSDVFKHIHMLGRDHCWRWKGAWGGRAREKRPYYMAGGKRTFAYRWVWELVHGPIPDGMIVLHSCDNGGWPIGCCNPDHMHLGSHQQNMDEMTDRERHGLPRTAVTAIRRLLEQGDTQQSVAEKFGVSRETVSAIATGRVYKRSARPQAANLSPPAQTGLSPTTNRFTRTTDNTTMLHDARQLDMFDERTHSNNNNGKAS